MSRFRLLTAAALVACVVSPLAAWAVVTPAGSSNDVKAGANAWAAKDYATAVRIWRPLADGGDPDAQFNLAQAYKLGRGVPVDLKMAQSWYEKAAAQGHPQAGALLGLILFQNGERQEAMPWIQKAAEDGDPNAQYVYGTALFNGDFVPQDMTRAYAMMTLSAQQGLPPAAETVTEMDKYIPLDQRQKAVQLAQQLKSQMSTDPVGAAVPQAAGPAPARASQPVRVAQSAPPAPPAPPRPAAKGPPQVFTPPLIKQAAPIQTASITPKPMVKAQPPAAPKPAAVAAATPGGRWRVQFGAFANPQIARTQWASISQRVSGIGGLQASYEPYSGLTRLRVGPLANKAAADRVCATAKAAGQACFPVAP